MAEFKTPGVYIQEISTLPASVAPVATAIPAFIGYTQKREENDEAFAVNIPKRITSMLEFEEMFGGAFNEFYNVTISDPAAGETKPTLGVVYREMGGNVSPYLLHHQVKMFFANGGGACYIISVGDFVAVTTATLPLAASLPNPSSILKANLKSGIAACEQVDEITILCAPEAVILASAADRKELYDDMLTQCANLQDRFAVMDALSDESSTVFNDGNRFRSNDVGADNLKYGAAYYPKMETLYSYPFLDDQVSIADSRTTGALYDTHRLSSIANGTQYDGTDINAAATLTLKVENHALFAGDSITINGVPLVEGVGIPDTYTTNSELATEIANAINGDAALAALFTAVVPGGSTTSVVITVDTAGPSGNSYEATYTDSGTGIALSINTETPDTGVTSLTMNFSGGSDGIDKELYNDIKAELEKFKIDLYPCGAVAGIYARVDRDRGVWKAPANVSINQVKETKVQVTREEQENLNVDATSGKSINAIRAFAGKGILIWGARTLAGNDNEWRYVPVRRFYNFAEESIKKATEFVVFEPNDANTWVRTKAMIENFLQSLWRDGALAGASPEEAFFVKIGLGETMTAQDILEGRMNIEIGMAAVRPAEFIILKFSHKLQES